MTTYRYFTATSLDGFLADEHDSLDWLLSQPTGTESILPYDTFIADIGAIVTGRTTYDWVLRHVSEGDRAEDSPWAYEQPTVVFTHRRLEPAGEFVRSVSGPPAQHRAALEAAADGKDVWIVGGGDLAAEFARAGMLDEIFVSIAPVTLGAGKPLLGGRFDLELLDHGTNGALLEARYRVLGERS
ncbi:deaminase [Brachybacterium sp. P6-10-X1]|uniref:dihydrofolate reductase family protein n=1 Tax=Brachybacterium sp. P6-10-X1 TaxID=1903186 RepID=UPI000971BB7F|nr:dihydrofolate reductase family protein [Brachybacterium sp. P6-10-X1]APX33799.1 deaminase [Brachybacterium sp. P6-10-X1]